MPRPFFFTGSGETTINLTVGTTSNYNAYTAAGSPSKAATVNITVTGNVTSSSTGSPAMTIANFPEGTTISLTVNSGASIKGKGGSGGNGAPAAGTPAGNGGSGGVALSFGNDATVTNNGTIGGGGGGNGGQSGGGGTLDKSSCQGTFIAGSSGAAGTDGSGTSGSNGSTQSGCYSDTAPAGTGGSAGAAVTKNGNTVTITNNGTINGSVIA